MKIISVNFTRDIEWIKGDVIYHVIYRNNISKGNLDRGWLHGSREGIQWGPKTR